MAAFPAAFVQLNNCARCLLSYMQSTCAMPLALPAPGSSSINQENCVSRSAPTSPWQPCLRVCTGGQSPFAAPGLKHPIRLQLRCHPTELFVHQARSLYLKLAVILSVVGRAFAPNGVEGSAAAFRKLFTNLYELRVRACPQFP